MVPRPSLSDQELSGRARVRPGWLGRLVLQVEVRTTTFSACPPMPGRDPREWRDEMRREGEQQFHWRDAEWDDMHALAQFDLVPAGSIEPSRPWPRRGGNVNPPPSYARPPAPPNPPPLGTCKCTCGASELQPSRQEP